MFCSCFSTSLNERKTTMETIERSVEVLNDLIELNNDRIAGFEKALKELTTSETDMNLKSLFEKYSNQSRQNVQELTTAVARLGGNPETNTGITGDIHRAWMEVKSTFTGHDRESILSECERGEDAIKDAYRKALTENGGVSSDVSLILTRQAAEIKEAHDSIKALRDSLE